MKILVFADSHGYTSKMTEAAAKHRPDMILHLGDHISDCGAFYHEFPKIPVRRVKGNCDFGAAEAETDEFVLAGFKFFMTHGHRYGVKSGVYELLEKANSAGADVVLYGHTHVRDFREYDGVKLINPGSVGYSGCYGIITIENGVLAYESRTD